MQTKKEKNKSWLAITGFLLLFLGISAITYYVASNKNLDNQEQNALKDFYIKEQEIIEDDKKDEEPKNEEVKEHKKIEYIAVLKIPKINLERGLVDPSSYLNNIDYNVQILKNSAMPDQRFGNVMLAAHSGNARISYFRHLDKLNIDDDVIINYNGKTYNYKVVNIYDIEKTGKAQIIRNKNASTLTLVTCRHNTNRQIVVICELQYTNWYRYIERVVSMNTEKIIRERFKVFEKLANIGYNTDSKIINLKVEELLLQPNFNRSELMIAVGIKNALAGKKLVTFLCGIEENDSKKNNNIRKEKIYE